MGKDPMQPGIENQVLTRRAWLGLIGATGAAATVPGQSFEEVIPQSIGCVVRPAQTEGPYFVDEKLRRSDLRDDPATKAVSEGSPLALKLVVHRISGNKCAPLAGAHVDIWQCDAFGVYSDVRDSQGLFDTRGKKFLRGFQLTDPRGAAEFVSVYPGWYQGRTPHIHFKVRVFDGSRATHEFTSQLYFDDAFTDAVYALAPYNRRGARDTRNAQDRIFTGGGTGAQLMLPVEKRGSGYAGTFEIGLLMS